MKASAQVVRLDLAKVVVKTSELTGSALDYAVAKAKGFKHIHYHGEGENKHGVRWRAQVMVSNRKDSSYWFNPSENWNEAGPIIEREKIESVWFRPKAEWHAYYWSDEKLRPGGTGPTPLVAAMRCYVASKLGDEVEIPEELL